MTFPQLFITLRARWKTMLLVLSVVVGAAVALSLTLPRTYVASTQIVIDVSSPDPIAGVVLPALLTPGYTATQIDIVRSERLALMVVDRLKMVEAPPAGTGFRYTAEHGSARQYYAERLLKRLTVRPTRESSVLKIEYAAQDPRVAATIANEFAQAYVDTNIQMRVEPAKQQQTWFHEQAAALRARLDDSQRRLLDYQQSKGIVSADEHLDVETLKLQELSTRLTAASGRTIEAAQRQKVAKAVLSRGTAGELPEVIENKLVQQLKSDQARLEARLQENLARLGNNHPEIQKLEQELATVRARVALEISTVAQSLGRAYQVNVQGEEEFRDAVEKQRARVLEIKEYRDQLQLMQRDVDNAQRAYDSIVQRLSQTSLESKATQANVFVLHPALPPNRHSSPDLLINTALAIGVGSLLAAGIALLLELPGRRVRSAEDLAQIVAAPVIGQVRKAPRKLFKTPRRPSTRPPLLGPPEEATS